MASGLDMQQMKVARRAIFKHVFIFAIIVFGAIRGFSGVVVRLRSSLSRWVPG